MRIRRIYQHGLVWLALWATAGAGLGAIIVPNGDHEVVELPADAHLSADLLPPELRDEFECTCGWSASTGSRRQPRHESPSSTSKNSTSSKQARIFYLVTVHNNRTLEDAAFLFRGIRDPRNIILFHVDVKFDFQFYQASALRQEVEACPCGSHVEVASVHNATWSTWSMLSPTLWAMEKAVREYAGKWDVFINLSGDTLPVYKPHRIASLFGGPLAGINFITSSACETGLIPTPITAFPEKWHKRSHYSSHPASLEYTDADGTIHSNVTLTIYFGSQWMTLQPEWCEYLIKELERPDSLACQFRDYLIATKKLMTDETFIPTLMMHLQPSTMPKIHQDFSLALSDDEKDQSHDLEIYAIRYERMDEHVPSASGWFPTEQRYEVPASSGVEVPKPWGPYFLGVYDLLNIRDSGALYIRKVATSIDANIYAILPVDQPADIPPIGWPNEVKLSPVPNWEKKLAAMKEEYMKEMMAKAKEKSTEQQQTKLSGNENRVDVVVNSTSKAETPPAKQENQAEIKKVDEEHITPEEHTEKAMTEVIENPTEQKEKRSGNADQGDLIEDGASKNETPMIHDHQAEMKNVDEEYLDNDEEEEEKGEGSEDEESEEESDDTDSEDDDMGSYLPQEFRP